MRINKYLAHHNYASRREADRLIADGRVFINGKRAELGATVSDSDTVEVRGVLQAQRVYYVYYKPRGVVTVNAQQGEQEVLDIVEFPQKVYPIGRLDKDSEGLLLFTNDGRLTDTLLNPKYKHEKEYRVDVDKPITHSFLQKMQQGVAIGKVGGIANYVTKPALVRRTKRTQFEIVLTEGKNRQIRRMCGALGYAVTKLVRFRFEHLHLKHMKPGQYRRLTVDEEEKLLAMIS